jgi:Phage capsid family
MARGSLIAGLHCNPRLTIGPPAAYCRLSRYGGGQKSRAFGLGPALIVSFAKLVEKSFVGVPLSLLGYSIEIDENRPDIAAGAIPFFFGDFEAGYVITDCVGIRVLRDPYTAKFYVHFNTMKRVGGGPLDKNAIKFVKIGA